MQVKVIRASLEAEKGQVLHLTQSKCDQLEHQLQRERQKTQALEAQIASTARQYERMETELGDAQAAAGRWREDAVFANGRLKELESTLRVSTESATELAQAIEEHRYVSADETVM
jgi:septal ring factor EnvC (AmiA/AmiB activator)